jgi:uncharacterized membrane protein YfcA
MDANVRWLLLVLLRVFLVLGAILGLWVALLGAPSFETLIFALLGIYLAVADLGRARKRREKA